MFTIIIQFLLSEYLSMTIDKTLHHAIFHLAFAIRNCIFWPQQWAEVKTEGKRFQYFLQSYLFFLEFTLIQVQIFCAGVEEDKTQIKVRIRVLNLWYRFFFLMRNVLVEGQGWGGGRHKPKGNKWMERSQGNTDKSPPCLKISVA